MSNIGYYGPVAYVSEMINGQEIRRFADSNIQESINKVLSRMEPGKRVALIVNADLKSIGGAFMIKLGENWSFMTIGHKAYHGEFGLEAILKFSA